MGFFVRHLSLPHWDNDDMGSVIAFVGLAAIAVVLLRLMRVRTYHDVVTVAGETARSVGTALMVLGIGNVVVLLWAYLGFVAPCLGSNSPAGCGIVVGVAVLPAAVICMTLLVPTLLLARRIFRGGAVSPGQPRALAFLYFVGGTVPALAAASNGMPWAAAGLAAAFSLPSGYIIRRLRLSKRLHMASRRVA